MLAQTSKHCFKLVSYKCLGPNFYTYVDTYAKARPRQLDLPSPAANGL